MLVIFCIIAFIVLLFLGFFYVFTYSPWIKDHVRYVERFLGKYKIIQSYSVLEYEYRNLHPDQPLKLLLQLTEPDYIKVLELISNPNYLNITFDKKEPLRNLWHVTNDEFYLNTDSLPNYGEGNFRLSIYGNHKAKTILLSSTCI